MTAIATIPNLGPATEAHFARAGLTTAEEIRALGADEAYRRWLLAGLPPHFIGFYALVMGLQGRPWHDCKGEEKKALRKRFDALVAATKSEGRTERDAALNLFGVVQARPSE